MTSIQIIYGTAPYCLWLCVAGLSLGAAVASGSRLPMWPAIAAVLVGAVSAATAQLGLGGEVALFGLLSIVLVAAAFWLSPRPASSQAAAYAPAVERSTAPARLIGRVARSSGDFANGVGRVWIDGAEWAAELDGGGDMLPTGRAVRVTRVIGGVRLQVHPIAA